MGSYLGVLWISSRPGFSLEARNPGVSSVVYISISLESICFSLFAFRGVILTRTVSYAAAGLRWFSAADNCSVIFITPPAQMRLTAVCAAIGDAIAKGARSRSRHVAVDGGGSDGGGGGGMFGSIVIFADARNHWRIVRRRCLAGDSLNNFVGTPRVAPFTRPWKQIY